MSRVVAIHTRDVYNGTDEWRPLDKNAVSYFAIEDHPEIMGIDIGKVCFWTEQSEAHGNQAYRTVKVTPSVAIVEGMLDPHVIGRNAKTGRGAYSELMEHPDIREPKPAPKLAILADVNDDADKYIKKPAALPASSNAKRLTTGARFVITADTFNRYTLADVAMEKAELIEAGMWHLPNGGEPFTIRIDYHDVRRFVETDQPFSNDTGIIKLVRWIDFDMIGDKLTLTTQVIGIQMPGNSDKLWAVENPPHGTKNDDPEFDADLDAVLDRASIQAWWEKGNWFYSRLTDKNKNEPIAKALLDILVLSLMDRSVVQERTVREKPTPKQERTSPFRRGGSLYSPEQDVQEVTIRCPGYYHERGERGDPTGRHVKMHRRRGHPRVLHRGADNEHAIYIQPMWINAIGGDVPPPVSYTVKGAA
jgi:hypothetical protein